MFKSNSRKCDLIILLIVVAFACFVSTNGTGEGILNMLDHKFPFSFSHLLINQLFLWNDSIFLGFNQAMSLTLNLPYTAIFALLEKTGINYVTLNRIEYVLAIFTNIYFTYLYLTVIFLRKLNLGDKILLLLASTFFTTNVLFYALFVSGLSQQIFAFSFIGLSLYSTIKFLNTNNPLYLLLILISVIFIGSYNYPFALLALFVYVVGILSYNLLSIRKRVLTVLIFLIFWALLNSYWLVPLGYSIFISPSYNLKVVTDSNAGLSYIMMVLKDTFRLKDLLQLSQNMQATMNTTGLHWFFMKYFDNIVVQTILYIPTFTVLTVFLLNRKKFRNHDPSINLTLLVYVFIGILFLAKGLSGPFGSSYQTLFDSSTIFKMFRNSQKWMVIVYFEVVVLMSYLLIAHKNRLIKILLIVFLLVTLFPWFRGGISGGLHAYKVPYYYFEFQSSFKNVSNLSNNRALILDSVVSCTEYNFGTSPNNSTNIVKFISPIPIVDLFSNGSGMGFDYLGYLFGNLKHDDTDLSLFQEAGITHLYHQKDLKEVGYYNYSDKYFTKLTFGNLDVYSLKNAYKVPHIDITALTGSPSVKYTKINPSHYKVDIQGVDGNFNLNFLYTFDNNWKLYLEPYSVNSCKTYNEYLLDTNTGKPSDFGTEYVSECLTNDGSNNSIGEYTLYLPKKGKLIENHSILNKYANSWNINIGDVRSNYSNEYFSVNTDGTINLSFDLLFIPQIYYNWSLMFSLMLFLVIFLLIVLYPLKKSISGMRSINKKTT